MTLVILLIGTPNLTLTPVHAKKHLPARKTTDQLKEERTPDWAKDPKRLYLIEPGTSQKFDVSLIEANALSVQSYTHGRSRPKNWKHSLAWAPRFAVHLNKRVVSTAHPTLLQVHDVNGEGRIVWGPIHRVGHRKETKGAQYFGVAPSIQYRYSLSKNKEGWSPQFDLGGDFAFTHIEEDAIPSRRNQGLALRPIVGVGPVHHKKKLDTSLIFFAQPTLQGIHDSDTHPTLGEIHGGTELRLRGNRTRFDFRESFGLAQDGSRITEWLLRASYQRPHKKSRKYNLATFVSVEVAGAISNRPASALKSTEDSQARWRDLKFTATGSVGFAFF